MRAWISPAIHDLPIKQIVRCLFDYQASTHWAMEQKQSLENCFMGPIRACLFLNVKSTSGAARYTAGRRSVRLNFVRRPA